MSSLTQLSHQGGAFPATALYLKAGTSRAGPNTKYLSQHNAKTGIRLGGKWVWDAFYNNKLAKACRRCRSSTRTRKRSSCSAVCAVSCRRFKWRAISPSRTRANKKRVQNANVLTLSLLLYFTLPFDLIQTCKQVSPSSYHFLFLAIEKTKHNFALI